MDRTQKMILAVIGVALASCAVTFVTASSQTSSPLYTIRMEQVSSGMHFLPTEKNEFTYTTQKGYTLHHDVKYCTEPQTVDETCQTTCETCHHTCETCVEDTCPLTCDTCTHNCDPTCTGPTCPYTCEPTCQMATCETCDQPTCLATCPLTCYDPTCPDTCEPTCQEDTCPLTCDDPTC